MNTLHKLNRIYDNIEKIEQDINPESDLRGCILEMTDSEVDIDVDLDYSLETFRDIIEEYINEIQITNYSDAMDFLFENDCSLCDSMELAHRYDFSVKEINSKLLASLLKQNIVEESIPYEHLEERFEFYQDIYNKMENLPSLGDVEGDIISIENDEDFEPLIEDIYFGLEDILELTEEIIEDYKN